VAEKLIIDIEKRAALMCPLNRMAKNTEGIGRFMPSAAMTSDSEVLDRF
jgi:hypothetical protein